VSEPIDFDKMFDDLTAPEPATPPVAKVETPVAPVEPAVVEPAEPELVVQEPLVVEPPQPATDEDILNRFAEIVRARQGQDDPRRSQEQFRQQPQPQPGPVEFFSPEEKTALAAFQKDWPDVARAMEVRERALAQQLVGYVFQEVANTIRPLFSQVQSVSEQSQIEQISALIPDYAAIREPMLQWIEQQPAYLKPAYEYVRDRGTAQEVYDLSQRFKQAIGAAVSAPQPTVSPVARVEEPSLPAAARKAVASLAPVGSKRSVVVQGNDPGDFDGAFDTFAKVV
jgi:hypothetical protein